jgi:hypothetical protein
MENKTYTLNIRQTGKYQYEVIVPEIGATKTGATLDGTLSTTMHDIVKHLTTRQLILVFVDEPADHAEAPVDSSEGESQAALQIKHLGIAPQATRRERHLVFELSQPLTLGQARWLDDNVGKTFDRYYVKDEIGMELEALIDDAH